MKKVVQIGLMIGLVANVIGCATGPVRYKTFGHREFATVEMTRHAPMALKPLAAPVGIVADAAVIVLDTVVTPIVSAPIAFELMGPCPQRTTRRNVVIKIVTSPIWFTIAYPYMIVGMPFEDDGFYAEWFGSEGQAFGDNIEEIEPTGARDGSSAAQDP